MGIVFGHCKLGASRPSLLYFGQKEAPQKQEPFITPSGPQDVFTAKSSEPAVKRPDQPFQFNKTLLLEKIQQANTLIQQTDTKTKKESVFTEVYKAVIDEAVAQIKQANLTMDTRLFLADFIHEVNGFANRALNFLVWDNLAETATVPALLKKAKSKLYKPQPEEGPANTLTITETDALLSNTLDQVYQAICRYEPFIQENWIDGNNTAGCQKAFDLAIDLISKKATEKGIQVIFTDQPECEKILQHISMPPYKLYTVLSNLGLNAIKYTPATSPEHGDGDGTVSINLTLKHSAENEAEDILQIDVTDNGIGIPKSEHDKVVSGKRAQNALSEGIEGTGYGLQRVKKLAYTLDIESPVNPFHPKRPGTRITVQLPVSGVIEKLD